MTNQIILVLVFLTVATLLSLGIAYYRDVRILKDSQVESTKLLKTDLLQDAHSYRDVSISRKEHIKMIQKLNTKISRDLHDSVGSGLTALGLRLTNMKNRIEKGGHFESTEFDDLIKYTKDISLDVRSNVELLTVIESKFTLNLISVLKEVEYTGRKVLVNVNGSFKDFPLAFDRKIEREILLVFKELVNNILKHSKATQISFELTRSPDNVIFLLNEDSYGFDDKEMQGRGTGLESLNSRIETIGGIIERTTDFNNMTFTTVVKVSNKLIADV